MALSAKVVELRTQNEQQERSLREFVPTDNDSCNPKRKQWTSAAPTKRSTVIGSDTNSEIISTITAVSTQWREEMSETVEKISDRMFELQSQNTAAMAAQQQSTDDRFYQEAEQRLNSSQCYQSPL